MKKDFREMIGNEPILNSPPPHSLVYSIFVDDTYVKHFYTCDQIWLLIFYHLSKVSFIFDFIFDKSAPFPLNICFKRCFKSLSNPLQCIKQSPKC